ncbi:hypothetical protein H6P81_020376 [Aristolochia fimbriata]|uniref:J domain-containing protein n=1 Tax=Aristolochia fimbriata TaxID=158543 RepID=A0AAV7DVF1_ARIFI|nr:hypothetical protein H6P81_020376 [Aristolochia fimbriata]
MPVLRRVLVYSPCCTSRSFNFMTHFSTVTYGEEFKGQSAYEVLGVSETSSFAEIKASFRKLAKETHPDTAQACSEDSAVASHRFIQILAAYEILSDSERRTHYDQHLLSLRKVLKQKAGLDSPIYVYHSCMVSGEQMEVVEWLEWYRFAVKDIVSQKKIVVGSSYLDRLESEFYSAIIAAYYGPLVESWDLLPDCFEAEERSTFDTPEVLHLVSGRDMFGFVNIVETVPQLLEQFSDRLSSFSCKNESLVMSSCQHNKNVPIEHEGHPNNHLSDIYKDLVLHVAGKEVAFATRVPPKSCYKGFENQDSLDHIHIFLSSEEDQSDVRKKLLSGSTVSRILLGTITGLGTSPEEGSCDVYSNCGTKTHVIMKHRTLMVKHMHWYQVGDKASPCECRCSRAQLPPSKFWLFEPRCGTHDIGGWYVETFGRDNEGCTVSSRRQWSDFMPIEPLEKRLHPAVYLLALAYRTLDLEEVKRRKQRLNGIFKPKLSSIFQWCKRLI